MGAVQFIENMDRTSLTISDEEFEKNVEAAVSAIAEKHRAEEQQHAAAQPHAQENPGYQAAGPSSARQSLDVDGTARTPRRSVSNDDPESNDEGAAFPGLLRTIQKPLSTIGRIFSDDPGDDDDDDDDDDDEAGRPRGAPRGPGSMPPSSGSGRPSPRPSMEGQAPGPGGLPPPPMHVRQQLSAQEAAARQASAEVAEAQRIQRAEHNNVVETLASMFPDLDRDIISDVVYQKEGR